jgi:hypothetical protein
VSAQLSMMSAESEKAGPHSAPQSITLPSKTSDHSLIAEVHDVDVTVALVAGDDGERISPENSRRIRRKLDLHLLPVLFLLYVC